MFSSASKPKPSSNHSDRTRATPTKNLNFSNEQSEASNSTPTLREMIARAVADLRESHGSTAKSIYEYVSTKFTSTPTKVNQELEKSVEAGLLVADPVFYSHKKSSPNRLFMASPKHEPKNKSHADSFLSDSNSIHVNNNNKSPRTINVTNTQSITPSKLKLGKIEMMIKI